MSRGHVGLTKETVHGHGHMDTVAFGIGVITDSSTATDFSTRT